jgi:hypothetical protein
MATNLALLAQAGRSRGPDGGPVYVETDLSAWLVEPWNAATAALFLGLVVYWAWRLRGRYRQYLFLTAALPVLLVGAVGGTVYHAFRAHRAWLFMDWVPIALLSLAAAAYLWARLLPRWWHALAVIPAVFALNAVNFRLLFRHSPDAAIAINYTMLACVIILPAVLVLRRHRWRDGHLLALAAAGFAAAIASRSLDHHAAGVLPMGSHFLWHVFGAAATHLGILYLYRLRRAELADASA